MITQLLSTKLLQIDPPNLSPVRESPKEVLGVRMWGNFLKGLEIMGDVQLDVYNLSTTHADSPIKRKDNSTVALRLLLWRFLDFCLELFEKSCFSHIATVTSFWAGGNSHQLESPKHGGDLQVGHAAQGEAFPSESAMRGPGDRLLELLATHIISFHVLMCLCCSTSLLVILFF